jgi:hypothetical protein
MDTIASMRAFVAVAKTGSFSAAAQKLDLVPSVVTKRVTQLERIVGTKLFHRSTHKVVLSADGNDGGRRRGSRDIMSGRADLRTVLYMANADH